MIYKPKYCCQCGEKIERTKWTLAASRRFCQLCETDFAAQEWIPRIAFVLVSVFGVVGFSVYFQAPEKPLKIAARPLEQTVETKRTSVSRTASEKSSAETVAGASARNEANTAAPPPHQIAVSAKPAETAKNQSSEDAPTYFCGAATKKGAPCSRRVKGGGRCWQHTGQSAILPPEKLIAGR